MDPRYERILQTVWILVRVLVLVNQNPRGYVMDPRLLMNAITNI
jgi:hypothetical protein